MRSKILEKILDNTPNEVNLVVLEGLLRRYKLSLISDNKLTKDEVIVADIIFKHIKRYEDRTFTTIYIKSSVTLDIIQELLKTKLLKFPIPTDLISEWFDY